MDVEFSEPMLKKELKEVRNIYEKGKTGTKHYSPEDFLKSVKEFTSDKGIKREIVGPIFSFHMDEPSYIEIEPYYLMRIQEYEDRKRIVIEKRIKIKPMPPVTTNISDTHIPESELVSELVIEVKR